MKALLSTATGGPETLVLGELPRPSAGKGQIVIDVKACAVNFPDVLIIEDKYQFRPERPFAPGGEVAGLVAEVGEGVTDFKVGDEEITPPGAGASFGLAEGVQAPPGATEGAKMALLRKAAPVYRSREVVQEPDYLTDAFTREALPFIQIDPRLRSKFGLSDVIQNTLLEAYRDIAQLRALDPAGRKRWLGRRPEVRGSVMNPCDHPHGGGEGKSGQGNPHPVSPWGWKTKGKKTRTNKRTAGLIIRRRN